MLADCGGKDLWKKVSFEPGTCWVSLCKFLPPPRRLCFHRRSFLCLLANGNAKTVRRFSAEFDGNVARESWKRPSDFCGGNPDHVTLGVGLGLVLGLWLGRGTLHRRMGYTALV